jgi:alkylhydroperoxidase/carboxymuconolactone decarboxylase family protein YurZ
MRLPLRSSFGQNSEQLPGKAREVAILVVSAKLRCLYELYAYVVFAKLHGISEEKVATILLSSGRAISPIKRQSRMT